MTPAAAVEEHEVTTPEQAESMIDEGRNVAAAEDEGPEPDTRTENNA